MSAVAQQSKTQSITHEESLTLMRNLMRTAISSVCYLRNLFPEDCFQDKSLSGIQIKSLQPTNDEARTLIDWLEKGVFEALKKKYLRTIIFGVCSDPSRDMDTMIESYEFKVTYPDKDEGQLNISRGTTDSNKTNKKIGIKGGQSKQEITQSMVMMLRTLITLAQTLQPVPETRYITMKLLYYEDVTPSDYEPSFFRALREDESKKFNQDFVKLKIGQVQTQYHSLNIRVRTGSESFEDEDGKSVTTTSTTEDAMSSCPIDKNNSHPTASQWAVNVPETVLKEDNNKKGYDSDSTQLSDIQEEGLKKTTTPQESKEEKQFLTELEKMGWFNFSLKNINKLLLSSKLSSIPADRAKDLVIAKRTELVDDMEENEKSYYKALAFVLEEEYITASSLSSEIGVSSYSATKLLGQMEKEGLLKPASTKRKGKKVISNSKKLEEAREFIEFQNYLKQQQEKKEANPSPPSKPATTSSGSTVATTTTETLKKNNQEFDYTDSDSESNSREESDIKTTVASTPKKKKKKEQTSSPTTSPPILQKKAGDSVDKRGVKRKTISKFEVSHSQDEITGAAAPGNDDDNNNRENEDHDPQSSKVSTVVEPIEQKKRKLYRDPKKVPTL